MGQTLGGAMNADHLRTSVDQGFLPSVESITSKGIFAEYFFDTGLVETNKPFEASYSFARCLHPNTEEVESYFALGMNCADDGKNMRNDLNCVIVLDISGSMGWKFEGRMGESDETKMTVAKDMLLEILKIMRAKDYFGIVLFDTEVEVLQPVRRFGDLDLEELKKKVMKVESRGGTDMEIGQKKAIEMIQEVLSTNSSDHELAKKNDNRIIFLTDACPNTGGGKDDLLGMSEVAAKESSIFTTFFGVGLDFNVELVEKIGKVRGSNYFSVHSRESFKKILVEDFNYIVTPVCYGCLLHLDSEAFEIGDIYGAHFEEESTNTLLNVETICAGPRSVSQGLKGGMILVKLKEKLTPKENPSQDLHFSLKYETREGKDVEIKQTINYRERMEKILKENPSDPKIFESNGVRKAVLLARFVDFMENFIKSIEHFRRTKLEDENPQQAAKKEEEGEEEDKYMSSGAKKRIEIDMPSSLRITMHEFIDHFKKEMDLIGDPDLQKEMDMLDKIRFKKPEEKPKTVEKQPNVQVGWRENIQDEVQIFQKRKGVLEKKIKLIDRKIEGMKEALKGKCKKLMMEKKDNDGELDKLVTIHLVRLDASEKQRVKCLQMVQSLDRRISCLNDILLDPSMDETKAKNEALGVEDVVGEDDNIEQEEGDDEEILKRVKVLREELKKEIGDVVLPSEPVVTKQDEELDELMAELND